MPGPRASTIVWAHGSQLAPPPKLGTPHPARLPSGGLRAEGAAGAGNECGVSGGPRFRGPRWTPGRGAACRVGEGTGNCRRGREGRGRPAAGGNGQGATEAGGHGWPGLGAGAASGVQTWPSPGTLLPGTQRRTDFRSLAHARTELVHKVAGGGGAELALPVPSPPRPIPPPPSTRSR